ncbi:MULTISPECIES: DUF6455 family protein [Mameliella]|uniref:DUF6455 family protein n=1 Tax=Mameliella TaxID=1434019 RepID=UPI0008822F5F|nr:MULTISPECIES: DUF6455 family protein [Mameliella]MBV6635452.1 hypothetical protein [Mameliella sp.]MCR9271639.1 DUF6455 family protein [Paracoccaceae bacterium]OWV41795.1 hypothetical protein CDZ95_16905 [Mameliella alba]OWV47860.1 hypothetical protein CDZ96_12235 [Mameliella alba]OWV60561.1 hypothetical protein CDZ97_18790 [Mameliella alba]
MDGTRPAPTRPTVLGDETEHYWLVQRMAKATGVDLVGAMDAGLLTQEDWAGLVTRCRGCTWSEGCGQWLNKPVDDTRSFPGTCLNRKRLAALQDAMEGTTS